MTIRAAYALLGKAPALILALIPVASAITDQRNRAANQYLWLLGKDQVPSP